jgi:hypothetical protein
LGIFFLIFFFYQDGGSYLENVENERAKHNNEIKKHKIQARILKILTDLNQKAIKPLKNVIAKDNIIPTPIIMVPEYCNVLLAYKVKAIKIGSLM